MELVMKDIAKQGLTTIDDLKQLSREDGRKILILDDLAAQSVKSAEIEELFTRGIHHLGVTVVTGVTVTPPIR